MLIGAHVQTGPTEEPSTDVLMLTSDNLDGKLPTKSFKDIQALIDVQLFPISPPSNLAAMLSLDKDAESLVGRSILYRWPPRLGGWMVGNITAVNLDEKNNVKGKMCNFEVYYQQDEETAYHLLEVAGYALNSKAKIDSWVLLG